MDAQATIIAAIIAIVGTVLTNKIVKMNDLDNKSEWRKKIFDLASKDEMTLSDVYLLRTALRYKKKENAASSFDYMTNQMIEFCDMMIVIHESESSGESKQVIDSVNYITDKMIFNHEYKHYVEDERVIEDAHLKECIRIYSRYLLKHHWEFFERKIYFWKKKNQLLNDIELLLETTEMIVKELCEYMDTEEKADETMKKLCDEIKDNIENLKQDVANEKAINWVKICCWIAMCIAATILIGMSFDKIFFNLDFLKQGWWGFGIVGLFVVSVFVSLCCFYCPKKPKIEEKPETKEEPKTEEEPGEKITIIVEVENEPDSRKNFTT